jgi:preprotein translocase subunit Sss1
LDWDDREDELDEISNTNKIRHSMECPNCRSNTWSFCCFIPDFKKGKITEGCNECNKRVKKIWDRENIKISTAVTVIVLGVIGLIGFAIGYLI